MDGPLRVGLVGSGTIARGVAEAIAGDPGCGIEVVAVLARTPTEVMRGPVIATLADVLEAQPDVVVEAASHAAVRETAEIVLMRGTHFVCVSVGALADEALRERLVAAARAGGARLIVPSGAVGGLDVLAAAAHAGLDEVVIEQRKPAAVLLPPEEAAALVEARVVFEGTAGEVVRRYPKTSNVAAAVALAGLGFDATTARVVADPAIRANRATLSARGGIGTFTLVLENVPSANPRTSAIVAHSVVATLRRLRAPLLIGT